MKNLYSIILPMTTPTLFAPPPGIKPRPYQTEAIEAFLQGLAGSEASGVRQVINLPTGCHPAGQRVMLFDGSTKNVEEVAVGDKLMGPDSQPRLVCALARGRGPIFRVIPTKGKH